MKLKIDHWAQALMKSWELSNNHCPKEKKMTWGVV
jgi:hypothetical protein